MIRYFMPVAITRRRPAACSLKRFTDRWPAEKKTYGYLTFAVRRAEKAHFSHHLSVTNGVLISNEVIRQRAAVLSENITKWGAGNTIVTSSDPSAFSKMRRYFDVVLVDAPCSGEGMFRDAVAVKGMVAFRTGHFAPKDRRRILSDVWPSLKDGGILIYSTCTFNPAENEENISWFAEQNKAVSVNIDISRFEGIINILFNGIGGYGFHPDRIKGDGLFVSVIRKEGQSSGQVSFPSKSSLHNSSREEISIASKFIDADPLKLYTNNDFIMQIPVQAGEFAFLSGSLGIVKAGTDLLRVRGKDFNPLHDLALYTGLKQGSFPGYDADTDQAMAYLRRDNFRYEGMPEGWVIVRYRGVNLGFVKNIGSRINNYYPMEWRVRMAAGSGLKGGLISWAD